MKINVFIVCSYPWFINKSVYTDKIILKHIHVTLKMTGGVMILRTEIFGTGKNLIYLHRSNCYNNFICFAENTFRLLKVNFTYTITGSQIVFLFSNVLLLIFINDFYNFCFKSPFAMKNHLG